MITCTAACAEPIRSVMLRILTARDPNGTHHAYADADAAFRAFADSPADVCFICTDLPDCTGLARDLQKLHPLVNLVYLADNTQYMPDAFALYASGYIMLPLSEQAVAEALCHLRYRAELFADRPLRVRCFGHFEVFSGESPLHFPRAKCKELLAYLIDRCGACCTNDMIIGNLWPDAGADSAHKSMARTALAELRNTLSRYHAEIVIERVGDGIRVNPHQIDCDYYRYLEGDPYMLHRFLGEYMTQYEFAAETRANLQQKLL